MSKISVSIDHDIYKWLQMLGVKANGKLQLDNNLSQQFMNGYKIGELIQKIILVRQSQGENTPMVPSIDALKDAFTPGVRLFNWNLVSDTLQKIGFPFDQDIKAMLVQGDCEMLNEVLRDLMDTENSRQERVSRVSGRSGTKEASSRKTQRPPIQAAARQILQSQPQLTHMDENDTSNIGEIDARKPVAEAATMLEFFLIGLSGHLSLQPKQAASLLSNGNKYLAHVIVKGVKQEFATIINWLSDVYANLSRVLQLINENDLNISVFFTTIKPGLMSKNVDVSLWTLRTYSKMLFELANLELHPLAYEWFTREQGGLSACFLCLKRHSSLVEQICDVLVQACRFNTNDFFSVQFRKIMDQGRPYLEMINTLIVPLTNTKSMKEDLLNTGLIKFWSELALKQADSQIPEAKATAVRYLTYNWQLYPIHFEEEQNLPNQYLFLAKRATRERSDSLRYIALQCMFGLLEHFAVERNPFAAVLYKKLTFSLIENFDDLETRDLMEANFINLFRKFSSIPIDVLLEPLIKQCHVSDEKTQINVCDMNILMKCCSHPRMTVRLSLNQLDLMSKIYLNDFIMSQVALQQIQILLSRFIEHEPVQEFVFKLSSVCLANYNINVNSKRETPKINNPAFLSDLQAQNNEFGIMQAQKRSQIIELLRFIINLNQTNLVAQIKPLIVHHYLEIKDSTGKNDKGLFTLLMLMGNPDDIIEEVQTRWQEEKRLKNQEEEQSFIRQEVDNEFSMVDANKSNAYSPYEPTTSQDDGVVDPFAQLRLEEDREEQLFLKQNGLGVKQKVVERDKDRGSSVPKRSNKVDPKVLDSLASIRLRKEEQEVNKRSLQEEKLKRELAMKKQAHKDIAKRQILNYCGELVNEIISGMVIDEEQPTNKRQDEIVVEGDVSVGVVVRPPKKREVSQSKRVPIVNRALEDKQRLKEEQDALKAEQDEKYRKHQERVREQYQKMKVDREQDDFAKKGDERNQEIQRAEKEKAALTQKKKSAVDNKQKLQDYKGKADEDRKKKEIIEVEDLKLKEDVRRKEHAEFKKKQHADVQKMIEDKKKEFQDKGEREKKKEKKQEEVLQDWKNSVQGMLKEESEDRERDRDAQKKVHAMMMDPTFQEVFKRHERSLQIVHSAYLEYSEWRIDNAESGKDLLQFKGFANFASQFNIYPNVMSTEQSQLLYNSIARERDKQTLNAASGMNFQEFQQALLRIAISGQKAFDLISERHNKDMKSLDMMELVKVNKKLDQVPEESTCRTLEGFIFYLDLPQDKSELLSKLRALKLEYQKVVAPRDKRKQFEQKVGEDAPPKKKRTESANKVAPRSKPKKQSIKEQLAQVDLSELDVAQHQDLGVIGPGGVKEQWKVEK